MPNDIASKARALTFTRVLDAPRELVFDVWTRPEHLMNWWGMPKGAVMPYCRVDLRVGGHFHYRIELADGRVVWFKSVYREIVRPERLVFTLCFCDRDGNPVAALHPGQPADSLVIATFVENGGRTTLTVEHAGIEQTSSEMQGAYRQGWTESLERMVEDLAKAARSHFMQVDVAGSEIIFTRTLDATPERVYAAWTDPKVTARWWASPYPATGASRESDPPRKVVFTLDLHEHPADHALLDSYREGARKGLPLEMAVTATFEPRDGATLVTVRQRFESHAELDAVLKTGSVRGWSQAFEKLDGVLAAR